MYFRTAGPWGPGTGANLTAAEFDDNNWQLFQLVTAKATQGIGLTGFSIVGTDLYATLSDGSIVGPYILPTAVVTFAGAWQPSTQYFVNQIITAGGKTYIVLENHVSDPSSFDPFANDGHGNDFYGQLLDNPAAILPTGGATGMVLVKASSANYDVAFVFPTLAGLSDVLQSPAPVTDQLVYWNGAAFGYIDPSSISTAAGSLRTLSDVLHSPAPTTGQLVYWNGTKFSYASPTAVGGTINLSGLSDVLASPAPTDGQVLVWSSSDGKFTYASPGGGGALTGLSDVDIGSRFTLFRGDVLTWNDDDSKWENQPQQPYLTNSNTSYSIRYTDIYAFIDSTSTTTTLYTFNLDGSIGIAGNGPYVTVRQATQNSNPVRFLAAASVTFDTPPGRLPQARRRGSVIQAVHQAANNWAIVGDLAYDASAAIFASTGTISLDPLAADIEVFTSVPGASQTINLSQSPAYGQRMTLVVTTSGTSSWTLTFGTNFKTTGTLATGTVSGKVFTISFISDGTNFNEVSRTTAM